MVVSALVSPVTTSWLSVSLTPIVADHSVGWIDALLTQMQNGRELCAKLPVTYVLEIPACECMTRQPRIWFAEGFWRSAVLFPITGLRYPHLAYRIADRQPGRLSRRT